MTFGDPGIGDIIALSKLAWDVYKAIEDAPGVLRNVHQEVRPLYIVLKKAERTCRSTQDPDSEVELKEVLAYCNSVLVELNMLSIKYKRVGTKTEKPWDRFGLSTEDTAGLRQRLISSVLMLVLFMGSVK